ncbi:hypothetical protein ARMGADRAFT_1037644 [Armillaria gallica]|uniref:Uncharacterized protein n=1 Tax=Armillaria gallica TaxID=47427 RepID=A0A2H3CXB0_ARMGA|nr:hypothetical protein ARMGADRAFT_1037644 [Armillaria gallica]
MVDDTPWQILTQGKKLQFRKNPKSVKNTPIETSKPVPEQQIVGKYLFDNDSNEKAHYMERFKGEFLAINPTHLGTLSGSFLRHLARAYDLNQSWILAGSPNYKVNQGTARFEIEWCLQITTSNATATYDLVGLCYFGQSHFVAQFVDRHGVLWFQDGAVNGGLFVNEGYAADHSSESIFCHRDMTLGALVYLKRGDGPWRF